MITNTPPLSVWSLAASEPTGFESFFDHHVEEKTYYGSGKVALRDGLDTVTTRGENVLLPSYIPDAVAEPIRELGLEPRYYAVRRDFGANLADVESRIDDQTGAILSVNYFGFPQPELDAIAEIASDADCYHVDDNAHAPISVHEGQLLGTHGHLGITSLWKLLPVPNGALLYINDPEIAAQFTPSTVAGVSDRLGLHDYRFLLKSVVQDTLERNPSVRRSVDALVADSGLGEVPASPTSRYEGGKRQMSVLTRRVLADADRRSIRDRRRRNFQSWQRLAASRDDVEPVVESLPDGICPQVFPIYARDVTTLLAELERRGVDGAHTWPRLSNRVDGNPTYEVANSLSEEVVVLPVHQHVDPDEIEAVCDRLCG
ncbi:DegT/DnrJ/EryC1/StrS family aminotransferase [Halobacteria archaeon AArc-dxtr1]|nr:DegT/DnrJ/EryC1/StrS family aminotransferase [Halobacteria archaeon AArc-dxtr1]